MNKNKIFGMSFMAVLIGVASLALADVYPLDTCPVSGSKLGSMGDPVVKNYNGREVRFCCAGCPQQYEKNPAKYNAKIDAALIKQQRELYPLDTCVVSGGKLGSMGDPVDYVHNNRLVRFCCAGCIDTYKKDTAKYNQILDKAVVEQQQATYPLDTCVVSGGKLGSMGDPVEYVANNRLIRFCCKGCIAMFEKEPAKYLEKLDGKQSAAKGASEGSGSTSK